MGGPLRKAWPLSAVAQEGKASHHTRVRARCKADAAASDPLRATSSTFEACAAKWPSGAISTGTGAVESNLLDFDGVRAAWEGLTRGGHMDAKAMRTKCVRRVPRPMVEYQGRYNGFAWSPVDGTDKLITIAREKTRVLRPAVPGHCEGPDTGAAEVQRKREWGRTRRRGSTTDNRTVVEQRRRDGHKR